MSPRTVRATLAGVDEDVLAARHLAESLLSSELPRRWSHVVSVGRLAEELAASLPVEPHLLASAAWLHDIGYASALVDTGFHALDGARYLRKFGYSGRLAALVAHHSCAWMEAERRGLDEDLIKEFPREESPTADALWFCDMTIGPNGERMKVAARLGEIRARYGPGHVVTQFVDQAEAEIVAAVWRTQGRLRVAGHSI